VTLQIYLYTHTYAYIYAFGSHASLGGGGASSSHVTLVDHFMYRPWTLHRRRFVGKPNVSECARAYIWLLRVSRVHVRRTKTSAGRRERRRGWESRVQRIYYDLLADPRSVCHPCPLLRPLRSPLALSSSLILLLFLLYYDGLLHFHSDAGLKIKSLIHDAWMTILSRKALNRGKDIFERRSIASCVSTCHFSEYIFLEYYK